MKAIIMAGGEGVRMRPMTCSLPKPMIPVVDRPVMEHIINLLKKNDITQIAVTLHYMPHQIKNYFEDGKDFGVELSYFIEDAPLGTAGSVKNCGDFINDDFVIISGDALTDVNLTEAINFHKKNKALVTMVLKKVDIPVEYGVVITDSDGRVKGFIEKPIWGEVISDRANTGIYIMNSKVMDFCPLGANMDFSKDVFPLLLKKGLPVYGYEMKEYWCDIGDPAAYVRSNTDVLTGKVNVNIPGKQLTDGVWVGENTEIGENVQLESPCYIGTNCVISSGSRISANTVIGSGTFVGENSSLTKCVVWNGCHIGNSVTLNGPVICEGCVIQTGTIVKENAIIGQKVNMGSHSIVDNGVKIWPGKILQPGSCVIRHLVWGGMDTENIFNEAGVSGTIPGTLTPESLSRLGGSFGAYFGIQKTLITSTDGEPVSEMAMLAVESGLASMGIQIKRANKSLLSAVRYSCRKGLSDGAIFISYFDDNQAGLSGVQIQFLDSKGNNLSKTDKRKLQNYYRKDDFNVCNAKEIKSPKEIRNLEEFYFAELKSLFPKGVEYDKIFFGDANNNLSDRECDGIIAHIISEKYLNASIFVSVTAGINAEIVVYNKNCSIVQCGASIGDVMFEMEKQINMPGVYEQYLMKCDEIAFKMAVVDYLCNKNITLAELRARQPEIYRESQTVSCDWQKKGSIIRRFALEPDFINRCEIKDGLIIKSKKGVVRLFPDENKPIFRIIAESLSQENAKELSGEFTELVKQFMK